MASCKGYRVLKRSKKAKKNVVIAVFLKIETRLKVLYVRLKGIPEEGLKALQIKAFKGANKNREPSPVSYVPYISRKKLILYCKLCPRTIQFAFIIQ
jgi:hypothetical protein